MLVMAVRRPGCGLCRKEASLISGVSDELRQHGVRVIGVLHEAKGADDFRPFLKNAELYFDPQVGLKYPYESSIRAPKVFRLILSRSTSSALRNAGFRFGWDFCVSPPGSISIERRSPALRATTRVRVVCWEVMDESQRS